MSVLATLMGMWALTYLSRIIGLNLGHLRLPPFWQAFLRFVPISVFAALIVPDVLHAPDWPKRLAACALGGALMWRTGSLAWGIVVGFGLYYALKHFV